MPPPRPNVRRYHGLALRQGEIACVSMSILPGQTTVPFSMVALAKRSDLARLFARYGQLPIREELVPVDMDPDLDHAKLLGRNSPTRTLPSSSVNAALDS